VPFLAALADELAREGVGGRGVAAGIDLCLHIIRADTGAVTANQRARALVAAPHRSGGQAQYIDRPVPPPSAGGLEELRAWALSHLGEPL